MNIRKRASVLGAAAVAGAGVLTGGLVAGIDATASATATTQTQTGTVSSPDPSAPSPSAGSSANDATSGVGGAPQNAAPQAGSNGS